MVKGKHFPPSSDHLPCANLSSQKCRELLQCIKGTLYKERGTRKEGRERERDQKRRRREDAFAITVKMSHAKSY
jgi:hypothetical protein